MVRFDRKDFAHAILYQEKGCEGGEMITQCLMLWERRQGLAFRETAQISLGSIGMHIWKRKSYTAWTCCIQRMMDRLHGHLVCLNNRAKRKAAALLLVVCSARIQVSDTSTFTCHGTIAQMPLHVSTCCSSNVRARNIIKQL